MLSIGSTHIIVIVLGVGIPLLCISAPQLHFQLSADKIFITARCSVWIDPRSSAVRSLKAALYMSHLR